MLTNKHRLRCSLDPSPRRTTFITAHESRYKKLPPIRTSDLIAKDVEIFLDKRLTTAVSDKAVFAAHQDALDLLIMKLRSQGKPLKMMKDGYDSLISELAEAARNHDKKKLQKTKSILMMSQYADEEKGNVASKMDKLVAHIQLVKNLTEELTKETAKLQGEVRTMKRENADRDLMVRVKGCRRDDLNRELESVNARNDEVHEALAQKREKIEELKRKLQSELDGTTGVLENVYDLNVEVAKRKKEMAAMETEMELVRERMSASEAEENKLTKEISDARDELQTVLDEKLKLETRIEELERAIAKASVC